MCSGRVFLDRKIVGSDIWADSDLFKFFVLLIMDARFKASYKHARGENIVLERGQAFIAEATLAETMGVHRNVIRRWLKYLADTERITRSVVMPRDRKGPKTRPLGTVITICNYDKYQGSAQKTRPLEAQNGTAQKKDQKNVKPQKREKVERCGRAAGPVASPGTKPVLSPAVAEVGMSEVMDTDPRLLELVSITPTAPLSASAAFDNKRYPNQPQAHTEHESYPNQETGQGNGYHNHPEAPGPVNRPIHKPSAPANPFHEEFERRMIEIQRKHARKVQVEKDSEAGRLRGSISDPWLFAPVSEERAA